LQPIQLGAVNVTYTTIPGRLSLTNQTEENLAEPEVDFVPVLGFMVLEEGETAKAINITILEVKLAVSLLLLLNLK
jgi:G-protein coupled receptor 98